MNFEEVTHTRNWNILKNIAFPLKRLMLENLDNDIYSVATHIQRHNKISIKGRPINEGLLYLDINRKISINISRDLEYIMDAEYIEYDLYKLSEIILSFQLYFDTTIIRASCIHKEYIYSLYMQDHEIQEIAADIISKLNVNKL